MAAVAPRERKMPTIAAVSRVTRGGRKLTYELKVIQQPERARACGSGAKSSADRRPVDPPPVVELRVYEGEGVGDQREDVTFGYRANFFLFATLEVARPMAHGRVQQNAAPQIPVLTGMPVSGMAYLDRPNEAGYFIFPDLSVRHEGKYILSFNLYEETKEDDDRDAVPKDGQSKGPASPDASFDWRLEIKSDLFTVFSAKKFPGLAESTSLSRTVAEQGCRVRIRRDVRMRRRENKGDMDTAEDDFARTGRPLEQDHYREQSRAHSNASEDGRAPYPGDGYRSTSNSPIAPNAHPPGPILAFGNGNHAGPQFQAPPAPFAQPQQPYRAPQAAYQPPGPPPPPPQHYYQQPPPTNPAYGREYPASAWPSETPREREIHEYPDRRASMAAYPPQPQHSGPYPAVDSNYNRPSQFPGHAPRSPVMPTRLPPLRLGDKHESLGSPAGPLSSLNSFAPPLPSPSFDRSHDRQGSYSQYPPPPALAPAPLAPALPAEPARAGAKRAYHDVFNSSAITQPLHNGMRPNTPRAERSVFDEGDDDGENFEETHPMLYKRADGSDHRRTLHTQ